MAMLIWFLYLSMLPASGNKKIHVGVLASHFFYGVMFWLDYLVLARISDIQDRFTSRNYNYISYWRNENKNTFMRLVV